MHFSLNARTAARVMPSRSLHHWQTHGRRALDEIESAHAAVGGSGRGRRTATQQINQAYAVLLASQFQRFCRDLHTECVDHLVLHAGSGQIAQLLWARLMESRKLDSGNPNPGNIGSDFARVGLVIWDAVRSLDRRNPQRQRKLQNLNEWRNAIAHQDFRKAALCGRDRVQLVEVRQWRAACDALAVDIDRAACTYLLAMTGVKPWESP